MTSLKPLGSTCAAPARTGRPGRSLLAGLACAATLTLTAAAHAAVPSHGAPANNMTAMAFWSCTYRDNAPPNWEYGRYIEAPSKAIAEARMRAELPPHQSLIGCNATGG